LIKLSVNVNKVATLRNSRGGRLPSVLDAVDLLQLVHHVHPAQCTLVPVRPGEVTSEAGWPRDTPRAVMAGVVADLQKAGVRVSLFVDAVEDAVRWAGEMGADRVELYTEPFARAFELGDVAARASFAQYEAAADVAHSLGMAVNAGHDLELVNLVMFRRLPHLAEVSIGHALVSHALFVGLDRSVREYLDVLAG